MRIQRHCPPQIFLSKSSGHARDNTFHHCCDLTRGEHRHAASTCRHQLYNEARNR